MVIRTAPLRQRWSPQAPAQQFPTHMPFEGGGRMALIASTAAPQLGQFLGQGDRTAVFDHHRRKAPQHLGRPHHLGLHDHREQFFQDRMQEAGTRLAEALVHGGVAHLHRADGGRGTEVLQTGIRVLHPAKDQRLQQIGSRKLAHPLDGSRFFGQHIGSMGEYVGHGAFHLCYTRHKKAPSAHEGFFQILSYHVRSSLPLSPLSLSWCQ